MDAAQSNHSHCLRHGAVVLLCFVSLLALRALGPSDLYDDEQPGATSYMLDAAANGEWLLQRRFDGEWATKPPLLTWLGAGAVLTTGQSSEGVLKLPTVLSLLVCLGAVVWTGALIFGVEQGCVAGAMFLAMPITARLGWTARPDMLLTALLCLCMLAGIAQWQAWRAGRPSPPAWIIVFWLGMLGASLAKGPMALIALPWFASLMVVGGRGVGWRKFRLGWQVLGLLVVLGGGFGWMWAALAAHPEWQAILDREVVDRMAATEPDPKWRPAVLLLSRMIPWFPLFIAGLVVLLVPGRGKSTSGEGTADELSVATAEQGGFTRAGALALAGWAAAVVIAVMLPRSHRADHLFPAMPAAALVAAVVVGIAQKRAGWERVLVHLVLGAIGITGIAAPFVVAFTEQPQPVVMQLTPPGLAALPPDHTAIAWVAAILAAVVGAAVLPLIHRRRYSCGALAGCLCLAGILGVSHARFSEAATTGAGDALKQLHAYLAEQSAATGQPLVFYRAGYTPLQPLLGRNTQEDETALAETDGGALLVFGGEDQEEVEAYFGGRLHILARTIFLREAKTAVIVAAVDPLPAEPADEPG